MLRFGPAGASPLFYAQGGKSSTAIPAWLAGMGLQAFEYQCSRGVNIGEETARALGAEAARYGISLSVHGPYYINLAAEGETRENTKRHLMRSLRAAAWMGARKVVFHPGAAGRNRAQALARALALLEEVLAEAEAENLAEITLAPETTGKQNQLGALDEVLALCRFGKRVVPTLDFAHLHAREGGTLTDAAAFRRVLEAVGEALGAAVLRDLHIHFSPIEYTAGGERRHRNLEEEGFGPAFAPLAEAILACGAGGTVICESADRQVADALIYQKIWQQVSKEVHPGE